MAGNTTICHWSTMGRESDEVLEKEISDKVTSDWKAIYRLELHTTQAIPVKTWIRNVVISYNPFHLIGSVQPRTLRRLLTCSKQWWQSLNARGGTDHPVTTNMEGTTCSLQACSFLNIWTQSGSVWFDRQIMDLQVRILGIWQWAPKGLHNSMNKFNPDITAKTTTTKNSNWLSAQKKGLPNRNNFR